MTDPSYAEDLVVGTRYDLGSHAVSRDEIVDFAKLWDPQDFHVDEAAADAGAYGGLIASGVHTLGIFQRLGVTAVFDTWSVIAGKQLRELRFLRPVRPGDVLVGSFVIDSVEPDPRGRALVTLTGQLTNQAGAPVLSLIMESYVRTRPTDGQA